LQHFCDRTTGRQLVLAPLAMVSALIGSYPTPGLFNLLIELGSGSLLDLISHLGDGIIVIRCWAAQQHLWRLFYQCRFRLPGAERQV